MANVIVLRGAVDGSQLYVVPGIALVTPYQERARKPPLQGRPGDSVATGPLQTVIGEALVQFFGQAGALRVKGAPLDIANQIAGKV